MNAKRWTISLISIVLVCLLVIMSMNYFVDPYGYFAAQSGDEYSLDENDYLRELKAEHIKHFNDRYDAYFIGGSKGGAVLPSKLNELDGYNYYNCWVLSGNFPDYLAYAQYIVENTNAKKILLQISSSELYEFNREDYGTIYEVPAVLTGEPKIEEIITFLMKNPKTAWEDLTVKRSVYPCKETGERDLDHYYDFRNKNIENGKFYQYMMDNSDKYYKYFDKDLTDISDNATECINILKQIKQLCEENGVELQVYFAALFAGQMIQYESETFYDFMEEVVMICGPVWCFNTYNEIALCPYNFYNPSHFFFEVGDAMVDVMAGKENPVEGFGILLNRTNVGTEIEKRKKEYEKWHQYYMANGTLPYLGQDTPAYISNVYMP